MSGSSGNIYSPSSSALGNANSQYTNLLGQNTGAVNGYTPAVTQQATGLTNQYLNNPYQAAAQSGAGAAGAYGTGTVAPSQQAGAASLQGVGGQNAGAVGHALQTGFDPQNALYGQQYQQMLDQSNSINAQNGVAGTPYAAGLDNTASQNFNSNWLNQALGRQATAAGTAGTLTNSANTAYNGASGLGTSAINTETAASGLPASTYGTNLSNDLAALSGQNTAVGGASSITNSDLSQILSYLGYGTGATQSKQQESDNSFAGLGNIFGTLGSAAILA